MQTKPTKATVARADTAWNLRLLALLILCCGPSWAAPKFKVLHAFGKGQDGGGLWSPVTLDSNGNIYGATSGGGIHNEGVVFELIPQKSGNWSEKILHNFPSSEGDGAEPNGGLIQSSSGRWYGTTTGGGYHSLGTVFTLTPQDQGWAESPIYRFGTQHSDDGYGPVAGVTMDKAGNLFGATPQFGDAFELSPAPTGWKETILHRFGLYPGDGKLPQAAPVLSPAGDLYGTTATGGTGCGSEGCGVVYELESASDGWGKKTIHYFDNNGKDGTDPGYGALFLNSEGQIYGTTATGGAFTWGTVFRLTRVPGGKWDEKILHNFANDSNGSFPVGGVIMDSVGNLYGTTSTGGDPKCGCGVVFKLAPGPGDTWTYTVLHRFVGSDGAQPVANLIIDASGNLYGTTATGGVNGSGVVFEISTTPSPQ
ncbi:MAG TPA: choice-of-anchor tandem repeat GloVer-containing protein [Terriglobales bacterium]